MALIPPLIIGDLTIDPTRRLPDAKFSTAPTKSQASLRTEDGSLFIFSRFTKYSVKITGLSQRGYDDLRYLYEQDDALSLYSIVRRKEVLTMTGVTLYYTTRQIRTDDASVTAQVEWPEGTVLTSGTYTLVGSTTTNRGAVIFNSAIPAGQEVVIRYFPIISGYILSMDQADYDWTQDEESWGLTFEES